MILIVDFGSQTTHLIGRRLKQLGAAFEFVNPEEALAEIRKKKPKGIILSGGPMSVYETGAPAIDKEIFSLEIPILGICYGFQLTSHLLGGKVITGKKEYGPAILKLKNMKHELEITKNLPESSIIWMSHGDEIINLPKDFKAIGSTIHVPNAAAIDEKRKLYMLQFHPEVEHTETGNQILSNFITITKSSIHKYELDPEGMIEKIKETVGNKHVIGAVSGGVDSTVDGTLVAEAIGKQFTPVFVNNGLMRDDAIKSVKTAFNKFGIKPIIVDVNHEMLKRLKGITDGEQKRKIIGNFYIEVFEIEMRKLVKQNHDVGFLLQGTIYSDVIESKGTKHASKIKSHHNVGGLPEYMKLQLLEPLRELYKDEVRALGNKMGLADAVVWKQVFPGPGYAVRISGEVTPERLKKAKMADRIVMEEIEKARWLKKVYMSFPVMTDAYSTAVKGDGRFFGEVIALRIIESADIMTTVWSRLPYDVLQTISSRIVNEVPDISRVVYDITTKPPATMEWI